MTESADIPNEDEVRTRPRAECPLVTCEWGIDYPESGDLSELEPTLREHTDSHKPEEFMQTIGELQNRLFDMHIRIGELEAALRGANFIMAQAGLVPGQTPGPAVDLPEGLILPESAVDGSSGLVVPNAPHKHGDVVPGRGKLVGKKITDPMVLKDLKKGERDRGKPGS